VRSVRYRSPVRFNEKLIMAIINFHDSSETITIRANGNFTCEREIM
jgi:hypothetical protein